MVESIPKIRFSSSSADMQPDSDDWARIRCQVWQAMSTHGCFEAEYPELFPAGLAPAMLSCMQELFALPVESKMRIRYDLPSEGYVPSFPKYPIYEGIGLKNAMDFTSIESFANLLWPQGHPSFSETTRSTVKQLAELDQMVRRMIMESLGVVKHWEKQNESTYYLLRMIRYKKEKDERDKVKAGIPSHTDIHLLTVLFQHQTSGLQIQTNDGHWLPAFTSPNSFVVLAGDSLTAWSNGRIGAPHHRVMIKEDNERYSMAMFTVQKPGHLIQTPEELIDEEHPLLFKPFDAIEYQRFICSQVAAQAPVPLKAFCGVPVPQL